MDYRRAGFLIVNFPSRICIVGLRANPERDGVEDLLQEAQQGADGEQPLHHIFLQLEELETLLGLLAKDPELVTAIAHAKVEDEHLFASPPSSAIN